MAIDWINGFIIPIIELTFIGGIILFVGFYVGKAFYNTYTKQAKFFFKYKIFRKQYPESTLKWCLDAFDKGIGYYDAKKLMMIKMVEQGKINETLWIYEQVLSEFYYDEQSKKVKGGFETHDREFKRSDKSFKGKQELPSI
jgi:hypothetical protein